MWIEVENGIVNLETGTAILKARGQGRSVRIHAQGRTHTIKNFTEEEDVSAFIAELKEKLEPSGEYQGPSEDDDFLTQDDIRHMRMGLGLAASSDHPAPGTRPFVKRVIEYLTPYDFKAAVRIVRFATGLDPHVVAGLVREAFDEAAKGTPQKGGRHVPEQ